MRTPVSEQSSEQDSYAAVLAARYGQDRRRWPTRVLVSTVVVAFAAVVMLVTVSLARPRIEGNLISWQAHDNGATVRLEVRGSSASPVVCVLRAQDAAVTDIGYREFTIAAAPSTVTVELPTLFRPSSVAVLGCAPQGQDLNVPPPDFPPGVARP